MKFIKRNKKNELKIFTFKVFTHGCSHGDEYDYSTCNSYEAARCAYRILNEDTIHNEVGVYYGKKNDKTPYLIGILYGGSGNWSFSGDDFDGVSILKEGIKLYKSEMYLKNIPLYGDFNKENKKDDNMSNDDAADDRNARVYMVQYRNDDGDWTDVCNEPITLIDAKTRIDFQKTYNIMSGCDRYRIVKVLCGYSRKIDKQELIEMIMKLSYDIRPILDTGKGSDQEIIADVSKILRYVGGYDDMCVRLGVEFERSIMSNSMNRAMMFAGILCHHLCSKFNIDMFDII